MSRKSLLFLCLAAIGAYILYQLRTFGFDWSLFTASLWNLEPGWLLLSVVATLLTYVVRAGRWQVLLKPLKAVPMGPLVTTNILGFSAIYVFGRPAELVRPIWLTRQESIPLAASFATILVERVLDTMMIIGMFGLALLMVKLPASAQQTVVLMKSAAWGLIIGSVAATAALFLFRAKVHLVVNRVPFEKVRKLLKNFSEGLSFLDGRTFALSLLHSVLVWTVIVLQFWFMLLGMRFRFSVAAAMLILVGTAIASVAQVPGIGGGFQVGYAFCMTTFFAVPAEQAVATSMIAWFSSYVPTVLVGGFYMISHGLSLKDLRTATAD